MIIGKSKMVSHHKYTRAVATGGEMARLLKQGAKLVQSSDDARRASRAARTSPHKRMHAPIRFPGRRR